MLEACLAPWLTADNSASLDPTAVWSTTVTDLCPLCLPGDMCEHVSSPVIFSAPGKHFVEKLVE
eukprot:7284894-Heterocapsa_arctica.AAC.1